MPLTCYLFIICRSPTASDKLRRSSSLPSCLGRPHCFDSGPRLRTWNVKKLAVPVEILSLILLNLWAPPPACLSLDHLILRCVFGLFHLIIPYHPQQAERRPFIPFVQEQSFFSLEFIRGHTNQKGTPATSWLGNTSESSYFSCSCP